MTMAERGQQEINRIWYRGSPLSWLLLPLTALFWLVTRIRSVLYRIGVFKSYRLSVPVVVVGNLTVGGTGKTPVSLWLIEALRARGIRAGVISRGYGAAVGPSPRRVTKDSDPSLVGDEPLLIARRGLCPVVVHPDRVAAARLLLEDKVDLIIADDGLQHTRLQRDYEITVVDGQRGFGNGWLLPAGPLREPLVRLAQVDRVIVNGKMDDTDSLVEALSRAKDRVSQMHLLAENARRLGDDESRPLAAFADVAVHAVAGIGNPQRFFKLLGSFGLDVTRHALPDHATLSREDLMFADERMVFMTEKDAVKCAGMELPNHWYVPVDVDMSNASWLDDVVALVGARTNA